ncbi:uroporphyrinogen-III synthase [Melissospora conviva]|uniref:uroporphyrinogen-III synthase n=1 Tax=Melissospora conviva TaxID=3388432 RepID=UPI003C23B4AE
MTESSDPPTVRRRSGRSSGTTTDEALVGFTVGVTAGRRSDTLAGLLRQHGARLVAAPALRMVPFADDAELRAVTRACLSEPPDVLLATTSTGMRGWLEAAQGWGLADSLRNTLNDAYIVSRGRRVTAALRRAGLPAHWSPPSESCDEIVAHLRGRGLPGRRIVVQLPGERHPEQTDQLIAGGAEVLEIPVYRWAPPQDPAPLHRLVDLVGARLVDAVTFTSAPAVAAFLRTAGDRTALVLEAFCSDVLAACLGPTTASVLRRHGVPVRVPRQPRLEALAELIAAELPARAAPLKVSGHLLTLRGHAAVVDGRLRPLAPAPMAVLRTLANSPGRVLSRTALLRALPPGADEHAVEMAVARLRAGLGAPRLVQTVVKRGYRLRVD